MSDTQPIGYTVARRDALGKWFVDWNNDIYPTFEEAAAELLDAREEWPEEPWTVVAVTDTEGQA